MGYFFLLPSLFFMPKLSQIWPIRAHSCWLLWTFDPSPWFFECFLVRWHKPDVPGSSQASLSSRNPGSFSWKFIFRNQDLGTGWTHCVAIIENIKNWLSTYCHFGMLFLLFNWKDSMKIFFKNYTPCPHLVPNLFLSELSFSSVLEYIYFIYAQPYVSYFCLLFLYLC